MAPMGGPGHPAGRTAPFRIDLGILLPPFPLGGLHKAYKAGMQIGGTAEQFLLQQPGGICPTPLLVIDLDLQKVPVCRGGGRQLLEHCLGLAGFIPL